MPNGTIHDDIANDYLQQFDKSIGVSAMKKLRKFPFLQELGFNGQLKHMKETFHGLKEFNVHMDKYSNSHPILKAAWALIKYLAPKNPFVALLLTNFGGMGTVGKLFQSIPGFGKVFAANPDDLLDPKKLADKVARGTGGIV
jgi:hypothetical protein